MDTPVAGSEAIREVVTELGNTAIKILRGRELTAKVAETEPALIAAFTAQLDALRHAVLGEALAKTVGAGRYHVAPKILAALPGSAMDIRRRTGLTPGQVHSSLKNLLRGGKVTREESAGARGWVWHAVEESTP